VRARANVRLGLGISNLSLSLGPRPSLGLAQALKPKPLSLLGEICAKTITVSRRWPAMQASWFRRRARPRARHARTARAVTAWRRRTTAGVHSRCRHTGAALVEHQERRTGNPEPGELARIHGQRQGSRELCKCGPQRIKNSNAFVPSCQQGG
jgi:hypothetical protein